MITEPVELSIAAALTASPATRTITGTISVYGEHSSSQGIKLMPGAIRPRQPLKRVKLLRDHDLAQPLGYMTAYDPATLAATFHVPETPEGDQALADAANGLRDGLSIGFVANKYEFSDDYQLIVHEAEVYETSLVSVPDFSDAQVQAVAL